MCGDQGQKPQAGKMADRLAERLALSDAQKGLFKDLQDARQKARVDLRTSLCTPKPDFSTFAGHLNFHEKFLEGQLAAVKAVRPKLDAFYNSLDDKQKATFAEAREQWGHRRMESRWRRHHHHRHYHN
jgi:hypothetical protein